MNRKLKFRIFNTTRKDFSFLELFNGKQANIFCSPDVERSSNFNHPQQYAECTDKNGTDIYEGDILKWNEHKYKMVWTGAMWYTPIIDYLAEGWQFLQPQNYGKAEIIGNIYQNPELLIK